MHAGTFTAKDLCDALKSGGIPELQMVLHRASSTEPSDRQTHASHALCLLAGFGEVDALRALLKEGADVNFRSPYVHGRAALHEACRWPQAYEAIPLLLEARADVNLEANNKRHMTPKDFAVKDGVDLDGILQDLDSILQDPVAWARTLKERQPNVSEQIVGSRKGRLLTSAEHPADEALGVNMLRQLAEHFRVWLELQDGVECKLRFAGPSREGGTLGAMFLPEGLTHRAEFPPHAGFFLGEWIGQDEVGTAFHGTDLDALACILRASGRLEKGPAGDPAGVYHSEEWATSANYFRKEGPSFNGFSCIGVMIGLRVSALVNYSKEKDPATGLHVVPGPCTARWKTQGGGVQSCSEPEHVEIERVWLYFAKDKVAVADNVTWL